MNRFELIKFVKDRDTKVRQANSRERSPQTHQQTQREERTEIKTINYRKENLTLDTGQMIEKRIETKKKNKKIHRQKEERKKIIFFFRFHPFQISPFDRWFSLSLLWHNSNDRSRSIAQFLNSSSILLVPDFYLLSVFFRVLFCFVLLHTLADRWGGVSVGVCVSVVPISKSIGFLIDSNM